MSERIRCPECGFMFPRLQPEASVKACPKPHSLDMKERKFIARAYAAATAMVIIALVVVAGFALHNQQGQKKLSKHIEKANALLEQQSFIRARAQVSRGLAEFPGDGELTRLQEKIETEQKEQHIKRIEEAIAERDRQRDALRMAKLRRAKDRTVDDDF